MFPFGVVVYFRFFTPTGALASSLHLDARSLIWVGEKDKRLCLFNEKKDIIAYFMVDAVSCIIPLVANKESENEENLTRAN